MADAPTYEPPTLAAQVVEHALATNLHDWLLERRQRGYGWRTIADQILDSTGYNRHEDTVRSWYPDLLKVKKTAAAEDAP